MNYGFSKVTAFTKSDAAASVKIYFYSRSHKVIVAIFCQCLINWYEIWWKVIRYLNEYAIPLHWITSYNPGAKGMKTSDRHKCAWVGQSWSKCLETTKQHRMQGTVQLTVYGSYSHNAFPIGHRYALTGITWITRFIDGHINVQMSCSSWHYNIKLLVLIENTLAAGQIGWKFKMIAIFSHLLYSYSQVCKWYNSIWFR